MFHDKADVVKKTRVSVLGETCVKIRIEDDTLGSATLLKGRIKTGKKHLLDPVPLTLFLAIGLTSGGNGLTTTTYYTTQEISAPGGGSPKYHQESTSVGGHDSFTDFVTLVCQTTAQEPTGSSGRSPAKVVSYYTTAAAASATSSGGLYPSQPMARPVPLRIPGEQFEMANKNA